MKINKYSDYMELTIKHIFLYYDFPLFFISKSPEGKYYLNYYIEEVENGLDKWLFARISNKELKDLTQQRISTLALLKLLYTKGRLYHLFINPLLQDSTIPLQSELVDENNFDPESFPAKELFVEYDYQTNEQLVKVEKELIDSSMFKMVLKDERNSHDIGLDLFLSFLNKFKKSLNDTANDIGNKIMGASNHLVNLRLDSFQPSSFGIFLRTEPLETDLFQIPEKSLNNLFEIIEDITVKQPEEIEELIEIDEVYSIDTIKSIKSMLKEITENEFTLKLEGELASHEIKQVVFDKNSYAKLEILDNILRKNSERYTEEMAIEGTLTSVNSAYNHFRILTPDKEIVGKMSKEIFNRVKNDKDLQFIVPSTIKATVIKEVIKDHLEDEDSVKYVLVHYEQPE